MIQTKILEFQTRGEDQIINITEEVQNMLTKANSTEGTVLLFLQSTTAGLTIMEFEEGLLSDFPEALNKLAPKNGEYEHEKAWHDGNGHSHVRSSLVGVFLPIPFSDNKMMLGRWQQIVLAEFDVKPRKRIIVMQIMTDCKI